MQPIMIQDAAERAAREFARYPHVKIIWITLDGAKYAFGRAADGSIENIDYRLAEQNA